MSGTSIASSSPVRSSLNNKPHQAAVESAFAAGLAEHGERWDDGAPVSWGSLRGVEHYLCLEAGNLTGTKGSYINRRLDYISASWNGYGYEGRIPPVKATRFDLPLADWKTEGDYVLVLGQVAGDRVVPPEYSKLLFRTAAELRSEFDRVMYRPHPLGSPDLPLVKVMGSLEDSLTRAYGAVTYNSNAAVEAILAGVPVICLNRKCAAWPVSGHYIEPFSRPDRSQWLAELTHRNWKLSEIRSGAMWEFLKAYE